MLLRLRVILRPAAAGIKSAESYRAKVSIVNLLGVEVAHLFSGKLDAGEHSFTWDAKQIPPGMYECVVRMGGHIVRNLLVQLR